MKLSVAICTWNRSDLLEKTLERMVALQASDDWTWELLVVNNNCTDQTDAVLERYSDRLPLRRLFESEPGQSNARNKAVDECDGDLIVWTDDDVLVDTNWLSAYAAMAQKYPEYGFFGGPIRPWFPNDPPAWLKEVWTRVEAAYAARDFGDSEFDLDATRIPFGANFAIRTSLQRDYRYDPATGLRPGSTMRGDEVAVLRAMLEAGHRGRWAPQAAVSHYIPEARQTIKYLSGFYRGQGECSAHSIPDSEVARLFGRPRWLWRKALALEFKYRMSRVSDEPAIWIEHLIESSKCWGQIRGLAS